MDGFEPADLPFKFEAGAGPIASTIALATAIDYLQAIGLSASLSMNRCSCGVATN